MSWSSKLLWTHKAKYMLWSHSFKGITLNSIWGKSRKHPPPPTTNLSPYGQQLASSNTSQKPQGNILCSNKILWMYTCSYNTTTVGLYSLNLISQNLKMHIAFDFLVSLWHYNLLPDINFCICCIPSQEKLRSQHEFIVTDCCILQSWTGFRVLLSDQIWI